MKKLTPLLLVLALVISACTTNNGSAPAAEQSAATTAGPVQRISAETFMADRMEEAVVLDVRTPEEFASGHLAEAENIDFRAADFRDQVSKLDRDQTYYLYCRTGNRSGQASEIMRELGFTSLYNIGGISDLESAGATVVKN